jgi:hypothetical protein
MEPENPLPSSQNRPLVPILNHEHKGHALQPYSFRSTLLLYSHPRLGVLNCLFHRSIFIVWLYVYVWLPWLAFFRAFSSVVRQMPRWCPQRRGMARTLPNFFAVLCFFCVALCIFCFVLRIFFLCWSMWCLFCDVPCTVCVYMCTEQLPPGGYPIAVKYIISYHIISLQTKTLYTFLFSPKRVKCPIAKLKCVLLQLLA